MGIRGEIRGYSASELSNLYKILDDFGLPRGLAGNAHISRVSETNYELRLKKGDLKVVTDPSDNMFQDGYDNLNRKASKITHTKSGVPFQAIHYFGRL